MKAKLDPLWAEYILARREARARGAENAIGVWVRQFKFEQTVRAVLPGATFYWTKDGCIVNNIMGFVL